MTVRQRMIVKKVMVYHGGDLMADAHIEVNQVNEIPVVFQIFFFLAHGGLHYMCLRYTEHSKQ